MLDLLLVTSQRPSLQVILVVDDEPDIRDAVRDVLETSLENAVVHTASSGRDALDLLASTRVDLILTDYKMPEMNGVQLVDAAEQILPGVRHILVTAFDRELVRVLGSQATKERIVQKPLDPARLLREVERVLATA